MTDTSAVDLVLDERPGLAEVAGIVLVCGLLFAAIVHLDGNAARDEAARARKALAERAAATPQPESRKLRRPFSLPPGAVSAPVPELTPAPASVGNSSPPTPGTSLLALFAGAGVIMALAGTALIAKSTR